MYTQVFKGCDSFYSIVINGDRAECSHLPRIKDDPLGLFLSYLKMIIIAADFKRRDFIQVERGRVISEQWA